jgi:hypothetical protein
MNAEEKLLIDVGLIALIIVIWVRSQRKRPPDSRDREVC